MNVEQLVSFFEQAPFIFLLAVGILSLLVGSFLNVVIWRLPLMLKAEWTKECFAFLHENKLLSDIPAPQSPQAFNLIKPRSHCPSCQTALRFYENIPVISYVFLRGRCHHCHNMIPLRYPFIEIFCCILSITVAFYGDVSAKTLCALLLTWSLIALSWIDIDHQLLPDNIVLPMLWLGLIVNINGLFVPISSAIIGAIAGYLFLWLIYWTFKLLTGKEGMGYGDFKLTAMLGAWLGWQALPEIILMASLCGAIIGISMIVLKRIQRNQPIPFGPYLALGGWISLIWGDKIRLLYLGSIG